MNLWVFFVPLYIQSVSNIQSVSLPPSLPSCLPPSLCLLYSSLLSNSSQRAGAMGQDRWVKILKFHHHTHIPCCTTTLHPYLPCKLYKLWRQFWRSQIFLLESHNWVSIQSKIQLVTVAVPSFARYCIARNIGENSIWQFRTKWSKIDIGGFWFGGCRVNVIISPRVCSHNTLDDICSSPRPFLSLHFPPLCLHIGVLHL